MSLIVKTYRLPSSLPAKVADGAVEIIKAALIGAGRKSGTYLATVVNQRRSRSGDRFRVSKRTESQVFAYVRPGDNSTSWLWAITPPDTDGAERLYLQFASAGHADAEDAADHDVVDQLVAGATPAEAGADNPQAFVIRELPDSHEIAARLARLHEEARPYSQLMGHLENCRSELDDCYKRIETLEAEIKQVEIKLQNPSPHRDAYEKYRRVLDTLNLLDVR